MNKLYPLAGMVTLSAVTTACQQADKQEKKQYNIVYIMTDDHTAQMMSCYDTRYMETPNLDRIANEGVRFTNSFVANSLSGPSRACMLTGKHSCGNKFYDNTTCVFDSAQQTFPKLLRKAGYQTAIIGNGIWKVCPLVSIIGKLCRGRVIIIIRILLHRITIPSRSTDILPISLRTMPSTGWSTSGMRRNLSA